LLFCFLFWWYWQGLVLARQMLYHLSHFPSLKRLLKKKIQPFSYTDRGKACNKKKKKQSGRIIPFR
jgi:hypothetical protein